MEFGTSEAMQGILQRIRAFLDEKVLPVEPRLATEGFRAVEPELHRLRGEVRAAGLWAPQLPRDIGGMGLTLVELGQVSEALGRSPLGHFVFGCAAPDAGNMEILHKYGTPAQKER